MMLGALFIILASLALTAVGAAAVVLLVRGTEKKTKWGVNLEPTEGCPTCGDKPPSVRAPENFRQAIWGGWTCQGCGTELDKWGRPLD